MKTSFSKKLLACVMSLCMILTVCAGALSVSAAAADVTIGTVDVAAGEAEAIVPVTIDADELIGGAQLYVNVPAVANIIKVDVVTAGYDVTFASDATDVTATAGAPVEAIVDEVENVAKFVVIGNDNFDNIANTLVINFTFAGTFAEGTYPVTFADGTMFGTADEAAIVATVVDGAIVATAAHVCTPAAPVEENRKEADCENAGSYDEVVYCSECGEEISRTPKTIDALGHAYGTPVDNGDGTHTATCANDAAHTVTEAHTYTDGSCICGAKEVVEIVPVEDASIVVRDAGVVITETLDMRVRVRKSVIPADCKRAEIVVTPTIYDGSYNPTAGEPTVLSFDIATASANLAIYPKNFSMYALDLPMYVQVKCYDANDNYYKHSPVYTYYPADALKDQYDPNASDATAQKLNVAITDLLNMSAAAQTFFASNAGSTSVLKATVEAGNLVNKDWPQDYATTTEPTYNTIDNKTYGEGFNSSDNELRIGADLSGAPILSYSLRKATTAYPDTSKLTMTVSYTTYYSKAAGGEVVSDTITGDEWAQYASGKHLVYKFRDCAMYDSNKTITVVVNYDGAEVVRSEYSLESYIAANSTDGSLLAKALKSVGIFSASVRAYFSTLGTVDPA